MTFSMLLAAYQDSKHDGNPTSKIEALEQILHATILACKEFVLILDGLDEYPETMDGHQTKRQKLFGWIKRLAQTCQSLKISVTSRYLEEISEEMLDLGAVPTPAIPILVNENIEVFLLSSLNLDRRLSRLKSRLEEQNTGRLYDES